MSSKRNRERLPDRSGATKGTSWLLADEAAAYLRITRAALYQQVRRGRLRAYKFGRSLRFDSAELDAAVRQGDSPLSLRLESLNRRLATGKGG